MAYDRFIRTYSPQVPEKGSRNIQRTRKKPFGTLGNLRVKAEENKYPQLENKKCVLRHRKARGRVFKLYNDNYVQYGFKKENSSQEDTYKEDSLG